jgi:hypothetical protein
MQNSLKYFNDGKYKYIGLVDGSEEMDYMVWGGYNDAGFAIINSAAYNNNLGDTTRFMDQEGIIMKRALQTCKTLSDFENLLNSLSRPMGIDANFGVIDAYGGAAYYETGNYNYTKYDANDPAITSNGILIRTNHSVRADPREGFGFCRFNTALEALENLNTLQKITPQDIFNATSRNLSHSLTKTNLAADLPAKRDVPEYKFFIDYIPRESTSSVILIVGAKDAKQINEIMSWTILGFPLSSVALPVWISAGNKLPKTVTPDKDLKSPICKASLLLKDNCFPIKHDKGWNYINLSVIINNENNGYLQLLKPIEEVIFLKAATLIKGLEKKNMNNNDILVFYSWLDKYLTEKYKEVFDIDLF